MGGQCVRWLRDNLLFFDEAGEIGKWIFLRAIDLKLLFVEGLAGKVDNTADTYFVPAFNGLYAPYWQPDARG